MTDAGAWARLRHLEGNLLRRPSAASGTAAVVDVVRRVCGVQAQVRRAAALAVRARTAGLREEDVEAARAEDRSVVRGWYMRGTLQLVASEDSDWLLRALGPATIAASRRRYQQLGLDEDACERAVTAIEEASSRDGPLTREEITERLLAAGLGIDPAGQGTYHLIRRGALEGRLCFGPQRDGEDTWVRAADWLEPAPGPQPDDPLGELARRYLRAYAPASPADFAAWSGLSLSVARQALRSLEDVVEVRVAGTAALSLSGAGEPEPPEGQVRLLPEFDPYLLGHKGRDLVVAPEFARRIHPGGGMLRPAVIEDGWGVGTWKHDTRRRHPVVRVEPFALLRPGAEDALRDEADDVGRFLGEEAALEVTEAPADS